MGEIHIAQGETQEIVPPGPKATYDFGVSGAKVSLGRTAEAARSARRTPYRRGDRGEVTVDQGERIFAHAVDAKATVSIEKAGFFVSLFPRAIVGAVESDDGEENAPASDSYVHESGTAVDVNASTETVDIELPGRADFLVIHADDASGAYHVAVTWYDGDPEDGGTAGPTRDDNDDTAYAGDGSTDVFQRVAVAAPWARVEIIDDSAATNELDYSIYAR